VEPGETVQLNLQIQNIGLDLTNEVIATFNGIEGTVEFSNAEVNAGSLSAQETTLLTAEAVIDETCDSSSFIPIEITFDTQEGYQFTDSLYITIGDVVFVDSIETVSANWTHAGDPDLWHITTVRKHSGNHSWACSRIGDYEYDNNMANNTLTSIPAIIGLNAQLSFWAWYECPNYGTTGFYAEVNDGSGWQTLDFIGSGGALGPLPTGMDWYEYSYDLSGYEAGASIQVRFRFQSDDETATEGVYIDDIIIQDEQHNIHISAPPLPPTPEVELTEGETNIYLSWEESSLIEEIENFNQENYAFQGYNVYQLHSLHPFRENGVLVTTFDIADGVTEISEGIIDPVTGIMEDTVLQHGTDSGLQYNFNFDRDYIENLYFIQGKTYYFAVTAYTYNNDPNAVPRCTESIIDIITHTFDEDAPGPMFGDTLQVNHVAGNTDGNVIPIIKDPNAFTGHTYRVEFSQSGEEDVTWDLIDITIQTTLLSQQPVYNEEIEAPVIDGFQLFVKDVELIDFIDYTVAGTGNYYIFSHFTYGWAPSARAVDTYNNGDGTGTEDPSELSKDIELRFTGQYENPGADVVYVDEGTGSIATLVGARYYDIADHPMNPAPGSNDPFTVRIPFEVWNIDDDQQVNFVIYARIQYLWDNPFYAFNPNNRMYCWILNTPYHESVVNWEENEQDYLTWNVDFWYTDFVTGDVIDITYGNPLSTEDVFTFITDSNGLDDGDIDFKYDLLQNYPNPFNPSTTIKFRLIKPQPVTIKIYNLLGEVVRTLRTTGNQLQVVWDGKDQSGKNVASGIYFYRIKAGDFTKARKMLLLR
ncbi:MAG: T9SS type A sorting domain-containing protein, partial [Calditrichia bacterium]|nr:T9SS type A sorting domain-containing protein [Calditrichia bacterium]